LIPPFALEALLSAGTDDTVWTRSYDLVARADFGPTVAARCLQNQFTLTWDGREAEAKAEASRLQPRVEQARLDGDLAFARVQASSAVGLIQDVASAGQLLRSICAEAERIIQARSAALMV
jgi:nitronate monooxygenase